MIGVQDNFDTLTRNTAQLTIRFTFGGLPKEAKREIHDRMLDEIPRHLALGTGGGIPTRDEVINITGPGAPGGTGVLFRNNIWFFTAQDGSAFVAANGLNNCTVEHPCQGSAFNQTDINFINGIAPKANFYFSPGAYTLQTSLAANPMALVSGANQLTLNNGQSMFGRTLDYTADATPDNPEVFIGSIGVTGNNLLTHFTLTGVGTQQNVGIFGDGVSNVTLQNLIITDYHGQSVDGESHAGAGNQQGGNSGIAQDAYGIRLENSINTQLSHIQVSNIVAGSANGGNANSTSSISPVSIGGNGSTGGNAFGIDLSGANSPTLSDVTVSDIVAGSANGGFSLAQGQLGPKQIASATGGQGGVGGNSVGIDLSNSQGANVSNLSINAIVGGSANGGSADSNEKSMGGKAGTGGLGVGAKLIAAQNSSFSGISVDGVRGGSAEGGNAGSVGGRAVSGNFSSGGDGGSGGSAVGIYLAESQGITLNHATVLNITGGSADGGVAKRTHGFTTDLGTGGVGGISGNAFGLNLVGTTNDTLSSIIIDEVAGGSARGGDSTSASSGEAPITGGNGGTGGVATGMDLTSSKGDHLSSISVSNINGGSAHGGNASSSGSFEVTTAIGGNGETGWSSKRNRFNEWPR